VGLLNYMRLGLTIAFRRVRKLHICVFTSVYRSLVRVSQLEERHIDVMQSGIVSFTETSRHASVSMKTVRQELTPCTKTYVHLSPYF
jgi:hypothetical protein